MKEGGFTMNKFQRKIENVMESVDDSNTFKCETISDLKKYLKL